MAIRKSTIDKIRDIESKYGSLINAYEANRLNYSNYLRYKKICLDPENHVYKPLFDSNEFKLWLKRMQETDPVMVSTFTDKELYRDYFNY
jgi:hypothetical protein